MLLSLYIDEPLPKSDQTLRSRRFVPSPSPLFLVPLGIPPNLSTQPASILPISPNSIAVTSLRSRGARPRDSSLLSRPRGSPSTSSPPPSRRPRPRPCPPLATSSFTRCWNPSTLSRTCKASSPEPVGFPPLQRARALVSLIRIDPAALASTRRRIRFLSASTTSSARSPRAPPPAASSASRRRARPLRRVVPLLLRARRTTSAKSRSAR